MESVRVCLSKSPFAYRIIKDGDPNKELLFDGLVAETLNEALSLAITPGQQASFVEKDDIHECLVSMTKNESDFVLSPVPFGGQDFQHIFPITLHKEGKLTLFSAYNMTSSDSKKYADIFNSAFTGLSLEVLMTTLTIIAISLILLNISTRIKTTRITRVRIRPRTKFLSDIYAHFFRQAFLEFDDSTRRIITISLSLLSLFILLACGCVLSTELVIVDTPKLIETYDDVVNNPHINVSIPDVLKSNDFGGPDRWNGETRNGYFLSRVDSRIVRVSLVGQEGMKQMVKNVDEILQGRMVFVVVNLGDEKMKKSWCLNVMLGPKMKGFTSFPYYSHDPFAEVIPMTFAISQWFRRTSLGRKFIRNIKHIVETGIYDRPFEASDPEKFMPIIEKGNYYHKCMSAKVVMPDVDNTQEVRLQNLGSLFKMIALIIIFTCDVLLLEVVLRRLWERRTPFSSKWTR